MLRSTRVCASPPPPAACGLSRLNGHAGRPTSCSAVSVVLCAVRPPPPPPPASAAAAAAVACSACSSVCCTARHRAVTGAVFCACTLKSPATYTSCVCCSAAAVTAMYCSAGMTCARLHRGSSHASSLHVVGPSWPRLPACSAGGRYTAHTARGLAQPLTVTLAQITSARLYTSSILVSMTGLSSAHRTAIATPPRARRPAWGPPRGCACSQ